MKHSYDVIIVGGGVIGHSIAYNLSKRGKSVLVLEKDQINQKASSAAAGMLGVQAELTEASPLVELARASRDMFPTLAKELMELSKIDIEFIQKGMLSVAFTKEKAEQLQATIDFQQAIGEEAAWLTAAEVLKFEPNVSKSIEGAMFAPNEGHVDAPKLAASFAEAAKVLGARIVEQSELTDIIIEDGCIKGVKTKDETFCSESIVVTSGAWSKCILQKTNLELPMYPVKGECFSVVTSEPLLTKTIFTEDCYLVPKRNGRLIIGATMVPHSYDEKVTVSGISKLLQKAIHLLPALEGATWEKTWAGIRPQTTDGLPFLGEHPFIKGLFIASGHYRNGILLSPITGVIMADMLDGKPSPYNLVNFSVDTKVREVLPI